MTGSVLRELQRREREDVQAREDALALETRRALSYVPPSMQDMPAAALPFVNFCTARGVAYLPARCETVAAFLLAHADMHPAVDRVLEILDGIEAIHDAYCLPSPVKSSVVAAALALWPARAAPQSWPAADKHLFMTLPLLVQHIIARREAQRDREVRRCQSAADLKAQHNEPSRQAMGA